MHWIEAAPPTRAELDLAAEVARLPLVRCQRLPPSVLHALGHLPRQCQYNAFRAARASAGVAVGGWWAQGDSVAIFHAVVLRDGGLVDVTPSSDDGWPDAYMLAVDAAVELVEGRPPVRHGRAVPQFVRLDPNVVVRHAPPPAPLGAR